ncbi:hypothetical protein ACEU6E_10645 (plasmid) [Halorutilales archaeon Cl-col2-1]
MKTEPEALVNEIADDFNSYLSKGVRVEEIASGVDPNLDIDDIEKVLRIHFVLTGSLDDETQTEETDEEVGVIDFVDNLHDEVRRIKTTVTKDTVFLENEVRGRIDWQDTIKKRYRSASPNIGYSCTQTRENYNIDENLVLKRLLSVIYEIIFEDLKPALENPEDYAWFEPWIAPGEEDKDGLRRVVRDVFLDNVYLQRIEIEDGQITDRMIESVKKSRIPLYRNAAELLDRYRRLKRQDIDIDEAKELLENTFIRPSENERLFELYWVFRILSEYEEAHFKVIDEDYEGLVAHWEDEEYEYKMFHDSVGGMEFSEEIEKDNVPEEDGYLRRLFEVNEEFNRLQYKLLNRESNKGLWGGRPDILIEKKRKKGGDVKEIFVGEVKYTRDKGYAAKGLRELLEYMAFVKGSGEEYIENEGDLFDCENVRGMLFVDSIDKVEEVNEDIRVVGFGEEVEVD